MFLAPFHVDRTKGQDIVKAVVGLELRLVNDFPVRRPGADSVTPPVHRQRRTETTD